MLKRHLKEKCHFLALEDNPNEAFFLGHAFGKSQRKATVFVSRSAADAREYLAGTGAYSDRAKHPLPDAILTDLHMPLEGGVEFVAWLRAQGDFGQLPIFVLSGSSNPAEIEEALKRGANRVLMKPEQLADLRTLIEKLAKEVCAGAI
jgi:CheY-like chemotaxis protein